MRMNVYIFAEYSDIYKKPFNKNTLTNLINNANFYHLTNILSRLGYFDETSDNKSLINKFLELSNNLNPKVKHKYLKDKILVSRHGVLLAWKYLLALNNTYSNKSYTYEADLIKALKSILVLQEKYLDYRDNNIWLYICANSVFNYYDNSSKQLVRAYYIFIKIKNNYKFSHIINLIDEKFFEKYKLHIHEYIYLVGIINSYFDNFYSFNPKENNYFTKNWILNPYKLPKVTQNAIEKINTLFENISFNQSEGNSWSITHLDNQFDFDLFINKPILKINDNCYLPIDKKFLNNLMFNSLFYKLRMCYPSQDNNFMKEFGLIFENYVTWITNEMTHYSKLHYCTINEFTYGTPEKKSPDIMLLYENTVLVIEVKSSRVLYEVNKDYANVSSINKSVKKLIFNPLVQSIKAMNDVVLNVYNKDLNNNKVYYFLTVSMENFPSSYIDAGEFITEVKKMNNLKVGGFYSFSIEEFEIFIEVLCENIYPFGYFLEKYRTICKPQDSFKNFINKFQKANKSPIKQLLNEATELMNKYFMNI